MNNRDKTYLIVLAILLITIIFSHYRHKKFINDTQQKLNSIKNQAESLHLEYKQHKRLCYFYGLKDAETILRCEDKLNTDQECKDAWQELSNHVRKCS